MIAAMIKTAFKDFYELIRDGSKVLEFFAPQLKDFEKIVNEINEVADLFKENKEKVLQLQLKLSELTVTSVKIV